MARSLRGWRAALLLLLPALPYLWVVPHAGRLQYNDYYGTLGKVVVGDRLTCDPIRWLTVKSNEHTVAVATAIYAANVALTRGDNRALSAWTVAMMALTAGALWRLLPRDLRRTGPVGAAAALLVGALAFPPAAVHNVVMGFSGVMWCTANALALWALVALRRGSRDGSWGWVAAAGGLALLASLTYSTGLAAWAALLLMARALRLPWRRLVPVLFLGLADLVFEAVIYARPESLPPPSAGGGWGVVRYVAQYLGGPFGLTWTAAAGGLAVLIGGPALAAVLWRRPAARAELAPWVAVGAYGLLNAVATALGRMEVGGARSSRYATLAALYWLAVLVAAAWLVERLRRREGRWVARAALGALLAVLVGAGAARGAATGRWYLELAARQPLAELALVHGVFDAAALEAVHTGSFTLGQAASVRRMLSRLGHVPFDRPPWVRPGEPPPGGVDGGCGPVAVEVEGAAPVGGGVVRLEGVVRGREGRLKLALVDGRGRVVGAGVAMPPPWPGAAGWPREGSVRWAGYVLAPALREGANALLARADGWCRVGPLDLSAAAAGP